MKAECLLDRVMVLYFYLMGDLFIVLSYIFPLINFRGKNDQIFQLNVQVLVFGHRGDHT